MSATRANTRADLDKLLDLVNHKCQPFLGKDHWPADATLEDIWLKARDDEGNRALLEDHLRQAGITNLAGPIGNLAIDNLGSVNNLATGEYYGKITPGMKSNDPAVIAAEIARIESNGGPSFKSQVDNIFYNTHKDDPAVRQERIRRERGAFNPATGLFE